MNKISVANEISTSIDGFDPLATHYAASENEALLNQANRRIVQNILKSYTGYFDLFAETLQNALDALEAKARDSGHDYIPKIWITMDIANSRVRVVDNGTGMNLDEFKFFLKPNVSFKSQKGTRGQRVLERHSWLTGFLSSVPTRERMALRLPPF